MVQILRLNTCTIYYRRNRANRQPDGHPGLGAGEMNRTHDLLITNTRWNSIFKRHVFGSTGTDSPAQDWTAEEFWTGQSHAGPPSGSLRKVCARRASGRPPGQQSEIRRFAPSWRSSVRPCIEDDGVASSAGGSFQLLKEIAEDGVARHAVGFAHRVVARHLVPAAVSPQHWRRHDGTRHLCRVQQPGHVDCIPDHP